MAKKAKLTSRKSSKTDKSQVFKKWLPLIYAIFLFLTIFFGLIFAFKEAFAERIYLGIKAGELNLGGKTKDQALLALDQATKIFNDQGLVFVYQNKKITLMPNITAEDPDLSRTVFILENQKTVEDAFNLGRSGSLFKNLKNQIKFLFSGKQIKLKYNFNKSEIEKILKENFHDLEQPAKDAELKIISNSQEATIEVLPEATGQIFDYETAIKNTFQNVSELKYEPTILNFIPDEPKIKKEKTLAAQEKTKKLTKLCLITLKEEEKNWIIPQNQIREWLEFQLASWVTVGLNKTKVQEYLKTIAKEINVEPQNAKFKIENGKVVEFQVHQGGKEVDLEATYNELNNYILNFDTAKIRETCNSQTEPQEQNDAIQLVIKTTPPQIQVETINDFGIKELVGIGESNFAGSPKNRRHNIKVGAAKLNGVLIAPGEEFSLNRALGDVSGATGYLPELVIKGDKTIPEYGGGLCQIGTTTFRVALNAGLPITERKPHSYRVVYYEPAGMDATIYNPRPDLKFINDTPSYLLLQTKIEGDNLIFELWGTNDGRKIELSKPRIFNIVGPGPTKLIETEELAPGVKKCIERAHAGADAEFSRTITFANGETKTEIWKSHYVPWSAVCLVGKEVTPLPEEGTLPAEETPPETILPNTNTNTNTNANTNSSAF